MKTRIEFPRFHRGKNATGTGNSISESKTIIMKYSIRFFFALLATLTISSASHSQYRWHITHPDRIDTFYYSLLSISCSGESCSALGLVWSRTPGNPKDAGIPDSNILLQSTDGGQTWNFIDSTILQRDNWNYINFNAIDQIDSLDAIAVGSANNAIIQTSDGWKTWRTDTGFALITQFGRLQQFGFVYVDFSSVAEGVVSDNYLGYSLSTVDSGKDWVEEQGIGAPYDYGNSMFRTYLYPNMILTTHDNWNTIDTSLITFNGTFPDYALDVTSWMFGVGDTLTVMGNSNGSIKMAQSTDLGAHWSALPLPANVNIPQPIISSINAQTIVIAGQDTVGRIILSTDRGVTWSVDTVPLDNGIPCQGIRAVAVTGSGRVLASITTDSNFEGSRVLAYLETIPSSVAPTVSNQQAFSIFPNPATNEIQITSCLGNISILDPLGRSYEVKQSGTTLDISALPSGVYFVSVGASRAKFVKE